MKVIRNGIFFLVFFAAIAGVLIINPFNPEATEAELTAAQDHILGTAKTEGVEAAINETEAMMARYRVGYNFCHPITSIIGKIEGEQFLKFSDAVIYPDKILASCTGGYIHGVVEGYLKKAIDLAAAANSVCDVFIKDGRIGWYATCIHGVGHGLMAATGNDLPKALKMCGALPVDERFQEGCTDGVYMENFDAGHHKGDGERSPYMKDEDAFYPCAEQPESLKGRCYLHTAEHHLLHYPGDFHGALNNCLKAPEDFRQFCFFNAGKRIVQNHLQNPKKAERLCEKNAGDYIESCIQGMANGFQEFFTPGRGKEMCTQILNFRNRKLCQDKFKQ